MFRSYLPVCIVLELLVWECRLGKSRINISNPTFFISKVVCSCVYDTAIEIKGESALTPVLF